MKKSIFFLTATPNDTFWSWTATTSTNWNSSGNWSPAAVPTNANTTGIQLTGVPSGGAQNLNMDIDTTLNRLETNFNGAGTGWTILTVASKRMTFDGVNPGIYNPTTKSGNFVITAGITLNKNITIDTPGGGVTLGAGITGNNHNITKTGSGGLTFATSGNTNITSGSTLILNGGTTSIFGPTGFGTGVITMQNTGGTPSKLISNAGSGTHIANAITLVDTGAQDFYLGGANSGATGFSSTITGTTSKNLFLAASCIFTGTSSALTLSKMVVNSGFGLFVSTSSFLTSPIDVGDTSSIGTVQFNNGATYTNNFNFVCKTSGATSTSLIGANGTTFSGNIVLNSNSSGVAGSVLSIGPQSGTQTFSGVISNGTSNAANMTISFDGAINKVTGSSNTYTSPTRVTNLNSTRLVITGSISTSASLTVTASKLDVTGTVPATTFSGTSEFASYDTQGTPSAASIATISGNLTFVSGTTVRFKTATSNAASKIAVTGNVNLGSAPVNILTPATGVYTLMTYTGTLTGTFGTVTAVGFTPTVSYATPNTIILTLV